MIVYLHGFNSSPKSAKAQALAEHLRRQGRESEFACPQLPPDGDAAVAIIERELARHLRPVTLIGSSLGGFYATWFSETRGLKAVLINPATAPHLDLRARLGPQQAYPGGPSYELTEDHLKKWQRLDAEAAHPGRYFLLVETGDEVLDYRIALKKYRGCRQEVVPGGDHGFASFAQYLPSILAFADAPD